MINPGSDNDHDHQDTCVLVEGPAWGDAEFYGRWLLNAAKRIDCCKMRRGMMPPFALRLTASDSRTAWTSG